jgi:mannitol/fructose-specific phosphotransferase system IIA component (Ntr-type)
LEILGLASAFDLARDPGLAAGADALISTIPLDWLETVPVLRVSPLLTADDVALLRTTLALQEGAQRPVAAARGEALLALPDLLSGQTVELGVAARDWEQVVDRAGALLLGAGAVWPSYIEAMKDMIRLYGPYVVVAPGAVLLHAGPDMGGKRLRFSLVVLREPVAFGHESNDPVSVALAFSAIDHATHVRARRPGHQPARQRERTARYPRRQHGRSRAGGCAPVELGLTPQQRQKDQSRRPTCAPKGSPEAAGEHVLCRGRTAGCGQASRAGQAVDVRLQHGDALSPADRPPIHGIGLVGAHHGPDRDQQEQQADPEGANHLIAVHHCVLHGYCFMRKATA